MATPHVAGVAALLAEKHPDWTGARLKDALMSSSKTLDATAYELGAGRVDVAAALAAHITATGSADLGFASWPHEENKPVTRTVTYSNSSDDPVEVNLAVEGMPAGVATLADTALTVPAHGSASTTVTGDGTAAPVGVSSGRVTATVGGAPVAHTALGLVKEEERYTLTVHVKDRDGAPTPAYLGVQRLTEGVDPFPAAVGESGTLELRLKPGTYTVDTFLDVRGSRGEDSLGLGFLTEPEIVLDRDREITLDGRRLREIRAEVEKRTETRQLLMEFDREANGASYGGAVQVPITYDSIFAAPTREPATGTFEYRTVWRLGKPLLEATVDGVRLAGATPQGGGTLLEGRHRLGLVDAGTGTPAEYAGKAATGRAVLVRLTEGADPKQLAQAAQDAGAKALFVTDTALDPARWRLGTKGHSEWTFRSAETPDDRITYLPMLNLGFDLDTDLHGDVRAGGRLPVGISAEYVKGATGTGTIGTGTLEVSYDEGTTWTKVALRKASRGASWTGELRVPSGVSSVSLRAGAGDDRGGSVTQEVIRAVGVK